jgi:hypothetical protein
MKHLKNKTEMKIRVIWFGVSFEELHLSASDKSINSSFLKTLRNENMLRHYTEKFR